MKSVKNKIIATLLLVIVYKLLASITVPWANVDALKGVLDSQQGLATFNALMWGGLQSFSVILMGLSPYINALIIVQLLGVIVPKLEALKKEWEAGQRKINKITRWLSLPLAFVQSYGMILLLNTLAGTSGAQIIDTSNPSVILTAMTIVTAGTMFLVWLGEQITERGIANGTSVLISASVLSTVPSTVANYFAGAGSFLDNFKGSFSGSEWVFGMPNAIELLLITALTVLVIYVIIKFTEGFRKIPVIYTRTGREEKSYFPIKVNQAWMVPIIFSVSIVTFPSILGRILAGKEGTAGEIGTFLQNTFSASNTSWTYIIVFFALVVLFTYFYISITFNTDDVAESIQKRGGYIPGVRPGQETADYLAKVSSHLTLFGGTFLALIATFPYLMQKLSGEQLNFLVSGSGLIIIVSVVLDMVRRVDSEMQMYDYSKFK